MSKLHSKQLQKGFSLIEVLVSLALFTVVVTVSVGTLLVLINANAKAQSQQLVMSNLSFALDSMTREIRTGTNYYCANDKSGLNPSLSNLTSTRDCASGSALSIIEGGESITQGSANNRILYYFENGAVYRQIANQSASAQSITTGSVVIDEFDVVVSGSNSGDLDPPLVTLYIEGTVTTGDGVGSSFNIQTTVTQQLLDI